MINCSLPFRVKPSEPLNSCTPVAAPSISPLPCGHFPNIITAIQCLFCKGTILIPDKKEKWRYQMSTLKYSISSWKDTSTLDTVSLPGNTTLVESFAKQLAKWIGSYIANYFKTSRIKQLAYLPLTCARFILEAMSARMDDQLYNVYVNFTNKTEQYLLTFYTCYKSKHTLCIWFWNVTWSHQKTMLVWSTTPVFKTAF